MVDYMVVVGLLHVTLHCWRAFNQLPMSTQSIIRKEGDVANTCLNDVQLSWFEAPQAWYGGVFLPPCQGFDSK